MIATKQVATKASGYSKIRVIKFINQRKQRPDREPDTRGGVKGFSVAFL